MFEEGLFRLVFIIMQIICLELAFKYFMFKNVYPMPLRIYFSSDSKRNLYGKSIWGTSSGPLILKKKNSHIW